MPDTVKKQIFLIIWFKGFYTLGNDKSRKLWPFYLTNLASPFLRALFFFQFRNQYDSDVTTWSPDGRLHQVEYAMEAVKQGSATVGLKSKTHAVLVRI